MLESDSGAPAAGLARGKREVSATAPSSPPAGAAPTWMQSVSVLILALVDILFLWKYGSRLAFPFPLVVAGHLVVMVVAAGLAAWVARRVAYGWVVGFAVAAACVPLLAVDVNVVHVDRWMMVDTFLENAARGVYPYTPRPDQNVPGPLPIYFLLLAPFHVLGDIGLATVATVGAMGWALGQVLSRERAAIALAVAMTSVPIAYELAVRSAVLFNGVLVAGVVWWLVRSRPDSLGHAAWAGLVAGLALSTRSVAAIPLAAAFAAAFLRPGGYGAFGVASAVGALTFAATLLPLYLWSPELFAVHNPLLVQSRFVTLPVAAGVLVAAVALGWLSRSPAETLFAAGLPLFGIVAIAFALDVGRRGLMQVVFGRPPVHPFDIAYFVLAVPFLLPIAAAWRRPGSNEGAPW